VYSHETKNWQLNAADSGRYLWFLAMFRFATYDKLGIHSLVIIVKDALEYHFKRGSKAEIAHYFVQKGAMGFCFHFQAKRLPAGDAFFCT